MAVTIVGSADANGGNVFTLTGVTWPAGIQANDVALIWWTFQSISTRTWGNGITSANEVSVQDSGQCRSVFALKVLTGTESGDIGLTCGTQNRQSAAVIVYRGVNPTNPLDNFSFNIATSTATSGARTNPQIDPVAANTRLVNAYSERLTTGTTSITPPTGETLEISSLATASGSGGTFTAIADDLTTLQGTAAFTPPTWTNASTTAATYVAWSVTLNPGPSATGNRATTVTLAGAATSTKPVAGDRSTTVGLTGAAQASKPASGDIPVGVTMTGGAAVSQSASGSLAASVALTGTAAVTRAASGDLPAAVALAGTASAEHFVTGARPVTVALTGSAAVTGVAAGDRPVAVDLTGTAATAKLASGDLAVGVALTGSAEVYPHFDTATRATATARRASATATARSTGTATARRAHATATVRSPR